MLNNIERMKYALTEWAIKEGVFDDATFYTQSEVVNKNWPPR